MKKWIALVALLLAGCTGPQPEAVALQYMQAEALNDSAQMQALVAPGTVPDENWLAEQTGDHLVRVDLSKTKTQTTRTGESARVHITGTVRYTADNPVDWKYLPEELTIPLPVDRTLYIIRIEGTWYVSPQNSN